MYNQEVLLGNRFEFGENWTRFLLAVDDKRIAEAEKSFRRMLEVDDLEGKSFLDIGSGSGLSSLVARRLGARVHSFDFDPQSVACTKEIRRRYCGNDPDWTVEEGSVLDSRYVGSLGTFDVVYSWGVLHHTGAMWEALENARIAVRDGSTLFISIYNDQGCPSRRWRWIKKTYNKLPIFLRLPFAAAVIGAREIKSLFGCLIKLQVSAYVRSWTEYTENRGMSRWNDLVDWVGGYPFEVAKPEEIFDFYRARGYILERMKLCGGGSGCNEFVFTKASGGEK